MEVRSIDKAQRKNKYDWRLRDSDEVIHRGLLRLGKGSSGQTISSSILNRE
jgi:hypothetical protein